MAVIMAVHTYRVCTAAGNSYKRNRRAGKTTFFQRRTAHGSVENDVVILIPARLAASRLPGKPLADIGGRPMIAHVLARAQEAKLGPVVVATDSEDIRAAVEAAGGRAVMTSPHHPSGSDRIFEALTRIDPAAKVRVIVNVQGDEPGLDMVQNRAVEIGKQSDFLDFFLQLTGSLVDFFFKQKILLLHILPGQFQALWPVRRRAYLVTFLAQRPLHQRADRRIIVNRQHSGVWRAGSSGLRRGTGGRACPGRTTLAAPAR